MNLYYTGICQLLEGKRPMKGEGYCLLTSTNTAVYSAVVPPNVRVVTAKDFEDALVDGCKFLLNEFSQSEENKEVCVFNLYADEHYSFYIYINTIPAWRETVDKYYPDDDENEIQSLKYNQGDFKLQFFEKHMGPSGEFVTNFERIASVFGYDVDRLKELSETDEPVIAYEKKIFNDGFYLLAMNAVRRLGEDKAFDQLEKSEDFIYFASTGNDYVDYSLTMRKTIPQELFYRCFPDLEVKDQQFKLALQQQEGWTVAERLNYWVDKFKSEFTEGSTYQYTKTEYDAYVSLEQFGNELAQECLVRLQNILDKGGYERAQYDEVSMYTTGLTFSGILTDELLALGEQISNQMQSVDDMFFKETSVEMNTFLTNHRLAHA